MFRIFLVLSLIFTVNVYADAISLASWGLNVNGDTVSTIKDLPENVIFSDGFFVTGTGTISISFESSVPTDYSVAMFFDHEIIQKDNTFYNEYGVIEGTPVDSRLQYEIDEPGFGNSVYTGDIFDNFSNFSAYGLDNQLFYDWYSDTNLSDFEDPISDDVSLALGWHFSLNSNETAVLTYTITSIAPTAGFYLAQFDHDSPETGIYLQSQLSIIHAGVPEPNILNLFAIGMVTLYLIYRSKNKSKIGNELNNRKFS